MFNELGVRGKRYHERFGDEQMAVAMIDRLVHHGHLLMFDAKSYRMTHAPMRHDTSTGTMSGKEST